MPQPVQIKAALTVELGVREVITKRRALFGVEQARIHLDDGSLLGQFVEIEVVLQPSRAAGQGKEIAERMMAALAIDPSDQVAGTHVDWLERRRSANSAGAAGGVLVS